jgi:hypothetical protein
MAHLLICQDGKRFRYSHDFTPLLVDQMNDALAVHQTKGILRRTRKRGKKSEGGGKEIMWLDTLSNDYLYRPNTHVFNNMSLYEFTMFYEKSFISHDGLNKNFSYLNGHPGRLYVQCVPRKHWVIPRVSFIKNSLCIIGDLEINNEYPSANTIRMREVYAKTALLQFYPYRTEDDLKINDSYWTVEKQHLTRDSQTLSRARLPLIFPSEQSTCSSSRPINVQTSRSHKNYLSHCKYCNIAHKLTT